MNKKVGIYNNRNHLVVPIQTELGNKAIEQLQLDILKVVRKTTVKGIIIDLSGVTLLDTWQANGLFDIAKMVRLLGAKAIFAGIRAEIVVSLIEIGFEPDDVITAIDLEEATEMLNSFQPSSPAKKCKNTKLKGEVNQTRLPIGGICHNHEEKFC